MVLLDGQEGGKEFDAANSVYDDGAFRSAVGEAKGQPQGYGRSFRLTVALASVLIEVLDLCWDRVAEPIGRYKDKAAYSKGSARF